MQQKNLKASILIWVFFLTLIMSLSFISIQYKIKNSLSSSSKKLEILDFEKQKQEILGDINAKSQKIGENNIEVRDFSSIEYALKKDEILNLKFNETGEINLELLNPGIISYALNSGDFGKNVLPTYNTGSTSTGFLVNTGDSLKIKNFSNYSKIRVGASRSITYKLNDLPKTEVFKKSGKINLSLYKNCEIKYNINLGADIHLKSGNSTRYTNRSFFVKSGDSIKFTKVSGGNKKFIISSDYNISDMLENNTYKITKKTWGREMVVESGKIKN